MPKIELMTPRRDPSACFFVLLFEGRTGSSFVVSSLNTHPNVLCYPEILADRGGNRQRMILDALFAGRPVEHLNPCAANARYFKHGAHLPKDLTAVGFKVKLQQVHDVPELHDILVGREVRLVYLRRLNIVKAAVSEINAHRLWRKTGLWNAERADQIQGGIAVDPHRLVKRLRRRERLEAAHRAFFSLYDAPKVEILYEDLMKDEPGFFTRLLDFVGVADRPLQGSFYKNTPDLLHRAIHNYEEVSRFLSRRGFESYLD